MKICQRESNSLGQWVFAGLLFVLAMTFSLTEVKAYGYEDNSSGSNGNSQSNQVAEKQGADTDQTVRSDASESAAPIPEPATILLLAGGLGAMLLSRKRKKT